MYNQDFFLQALIYLLAAVITVPLAKKLGLGSVLGYLVAGVIIGPYALGWTGPDSEKVMHFAEFGVVLMLFLIGLEMQPSLLWKTRHSIFGMGGVQVVLTTLVTGSVVYLFGFRVNQALATGLIFALSSTAIVLQTLTEKGLLKTAREDLLFQYFCSRIWPLFRSWPSSPCLPFPVGQLREVLQMHRKKVLQPFRGSFS